LRFTITALCLLLLVSPAARAEPDDVSFPEGLKGWAYTGGWTQQRDGEDQYLANGTVTYTRYLHDNFAFDWQFIGYYAHDSTNEPNTTDAPGLGINALARYHLINKGRFSLYGDILGGVLWTSDDFPNGGTELNFTYAGGPGVSWEVKPNVHIVGGLRFQHVSNGFVEGRDRNPIMNSYGGYIGLMFLH
jgi:hypothetical protein